MIKDLNADEKKNCMDIYRPTGIIKEVETNLKNVV